MKSIRERIGKEWIFFDGGMGTLLQEAGLAPGELPGTWNLSHPEVIRKIHRDYFLAGCHVVNANTFGADSLHYPENLDAIVTAGIRLAKEAREEARQEIREESEEQDFYVALDIGPTGKLLAPMGDLAFEDAVEIFAEVVRIGVREGVDLILIETMNDSYEAKAAVLAAKENSDLPVFVTMVFDESGKMLTGGTPESATAMLEGLRVDALGVNCSLGPAQMLGIAKRFVAASSLPVIVNPNAGLPRSENGLTVYDVDAASFTETMEGIAGLGISGCGGCCGTTPAYLKKVAERVKTLPLVPPVAKKQTVVSSFSQTVVIGEKPVLIGERINPTGKKPFKEALKKHDIDYILNEGLAQEDAGADVLDVNVGLPEIDEPAMIAEVVTKLQSITALPLQIDTSDPVAMERALRLYNGKAMVNSVNGKEEVMREIFPLVAKYGGVVVGLALDESGIPETAEGRIAIAEKIYRTAAEYGIPAKDIIIDGLTLTVSSDANAALTTLETIRRVRDDLGGHTILGVSNVSFGLPAREILNANFLTMALMNGLSAAIMNPLSPAMMQAYRAYLALSGLDRNFEGYISAYQNAGAAVVMPGGSGAGSGGTGSFGQNGSAGAGSAGAGAGQSGGTGAGANGGQDGLMNAIIRGMAGPAADLTEDALKNSAPMEVINSQIIPALDVVGKGFEKGTVVLPQLLMSAEAAKAAFEVVKSRLAGENQESKGTIVIATVKGDIHDIGKNIVKVMLENYGYTVIDLGKDVAPEKIVDAALKYDAKMVGLSALMTTTVGAMEETIRQLRIAAPAVKVMVGGAVLTQEYADQIGADYYAKDAMEGVRVADLVFGA